MPTQIENHPKNYITVDGRRMAYVELGDPNGRPIIFQHGNPTSSYLWRNIMPHVQDLGRCIAIDLIGMGDSEKLPDSGPDRYTFAEHSAYFEAALEALGVTDNAVLVIHDWGSALGFHYASRHASRVAGICYMEAIVAPIPNWDEWPDNARDIFQAFRSSAGEEVVLEKNVFVEGVLPSSIMRKLDDAEMDHYRAPFTEAGEARRPTLTWPRQIPIAGEPSDVVEIATNYATFMAETDLPKLFINADPGSILVGKVRDGCRKWKNQAEVTVAGYHFLQEDSPDEIGTALRNWMISNSI